MTQRQQQIIFDLTKEFESINSKTSAKGKLIDIDGILGNIKKDKQTRQDTEINNKYHGDALTEYVENDLAILNEDLEQLGLKARLLLSGWGIIIETPRCEDIRITYHMKKKYIALPTESCSIQFYEGFDFIGSYIHSPHAESKFDDLESLTTSEAFKRELTKIYLKFQSTLKK